MATVAQKALERPNPLVWLRGFLKEELAPYPGRTMLVARMVIAATVMMIITMTFRVPYGAYGVIYALNISRENPQATLKAAKVVSFAFACSAIYILVGSTLFVSDPLVRFVWVIGTLFLVFYAARTLRNYSAATRFGYLTIITIPLWDQHVPAGDKVEGTLWAVAMVSIATLITALIEFAFAGLKHQDDLVESLARRLSCVEDVLLSYANSGAPDEKTQKEITRLTMVGASRLRRILTHSSYPSRYLEQMGAVVELVGRLVDLSANLAQVSFAITDTDRKHLHDLAGDIASIRTDLMKGSDIRPIASAGDAQYSIPLLREMRGAVTLISETFTHAPLLSPHAAPSVTDTPPSFFVSDAFSNVEHIKFALKGCFATSLCYISYVGLSWPGINTSITTCLLTALATIGTSRQKQVLRFAGAVLGSAAGMGAQIFILPEIDSIVGFTLLVVAFTIGAAWIATSSARFGYLGQQAAVAFYLINLQEFRMQTSLTVARDRVVGVFLGIFMMWFVFDQLWGAPAAVDMKRTFVANLRLLARYMSEPLAGEIKAAVQRSSVLRESINNNFDKVRSLADGVLLEFGPSRERDLELRGRLRIWQPELRVIFVTLIGLVKYRLQLPGFELPQEIQAAQREVDQQLAGVLNGIADHVEGLPATEEGNPEKAAQQLEKVVSASPAETDDALSKRLQTFLLLSRRITDLTVSLNHEIQGTLRD